MDLLTQPLWPETAAAAVLLGGMTGIGLLVPMVRRRPGGILAGLAIGYFVVTTLVLGLGCAGRLGGRAIVAAVTVAGAIGIALAIRDRRATPRPGELFPRDLADRVVLVLLALVGAIGLAAALVPEVWPDALAYHLALPKRYVEMGRIAYLPDLYPSGYPLSAEMVYTVFAAIGLPPAAKPFHFLVGLFALAATADLARRIAGRSAGIFAALLVLLSPMFLWVGSTANNDLFSVLYFAAGLLFLHRCAESGRVGDAALAGLCAGLQPTLKITGVVPLFLLAAVAVGVIRKRPRAGRRAAALAFAAFAALTSVPWWVRAWAQTGDPFFPLFAEWFGLPERTTTLLSFVAYSTLATYGPIRSVADFFLLPVHVLTRHEDFGYLAPGFAIAALFPVGLFLGRRDPWTRRLAWVCGSGFLLWAATNRQVRFLVYLFPPAAVVAARAFAVGEERATALRRWAVLAFAVAISIPTFPGVWERLRPDRWRLEPAFSKELLLGKMTRDEYLRHSPASASYRAHTWAAQRLPADAVVLAVDNADHLFAARTMIDTSHSPDAWWTQRYLLETKRPLAEAILADRGVTHLLVHNAGKDVTAPLADRLTFLYANERFTWYRLEPRDAESVDTR
jgi:hypothetical protein